MPLFHAGCHVLLTIIQHMAIQMHRIGVGNDDIRRELLPVLEAVMVVKLNEQMEQSNG